jgi:alanine racemase
MGETEAVIDLKAITVNLETVRRLLPPSSAVLGVVKANAYGHGAVEVARVLVAGGVGRLGVAYVEEGVILRRGGIQVPILVMGPMPPDAAEVARAHRLDVAIHDVAVAERLSGLAGRGGPLTRVHLKVDTGMARLGVAPHEAAAAAAKLARLPGIRLEGLMSHFADGEEADAARWQLDRFLEVDRALRAAGVAPLLRHVANSAGLLALPAAHLELVRPGLLLYGYSPSPRLADRLSLCPALTFRTRIAALRDVSRGQGVSYGHTFVAPRDLRVATLPVGYADGLPRVLSNRGYVLAGGRRAPIVGTICMDMTLVDVTTIPQAAAGDEVILIGRQEGEAIGANEVATAAGTIAYEILAGIGPRVTRTYR